MDNYFSNDWSQMFVNLAFQMAIPALSHTANSSLALCSVLFSATTIAKLGSGYSCTFDAVGVQLVTITLGVGSTLNIGDNITVNANTIYLQGNTSAPVNFYTQIVVKGALSPNSLGASITGPTAAFIICQQVSL